MSSDSATVQALKVAKDGLGDVTRSLTESAEDSVKNSKCHQLNRRIFANEEKLRNLGATSDPLKQKRFEFGRLRPEGQDQAILEAIRNFEEAFDALKEIDRRTMVFASAFLLSSAFYPLLPVFVSWPMSVLGTGGSLMSLGSRKAYYINYHEARSNLKLALAWMVKRVPSDNWQAAAENENVLKATELLLPVMKERTPGIRNAPGTLDGLIDDNVEGDILRNVRARMQAKQPAHDEDPMDWVNKYFQKEQSTMSFMLYGDGRGTVLDFTKGIWFSIYNLFASLVNWVKGEEQMQKREALEYGEGGLQLSPR